MLDVSVRVEPNFIHGEENPMRCRPSSRVVSGLLGFGLLCAATQTTNAQFASSNVGLYKNFSNASFGTGANGAANCKAYVSPSGREYAIIGLSNAVAVVEITTPANSTILTNKIMGPSSVWREFAQYGNYAYCGIEQTGQGMQIIDISQVDSNIVSLVKTETLGGSLSTIHSLQANAASGYLYLNGSNMGGLQILSLADPVNPTVVGSWFGHYVHDSYLHTYTSGPYAGLEIAFLFGGSAGMTILDVTNKAAPFVRANISYPNRTYTHQGFPTPNMKYMLIDDELDETNSPNVNFSTTYVLDIENLDAPFFVTSIQFGIPSIDHNLFINEVNGSLYAFEANYTSGLRIYDVTDVNNASVAGWFDTYPPNNAQNYNGAWGADRVPSGTVIVSDINRGLFVLDVRQALGLAVAPETPLPAAAPHDFRKHRYVSIASNPANISPTAIEVRMTSGPSAPGLIGWVDAPNANGVSRIVESAVTRLWTESVIHVAGCPIVPAANYEFRSTNDQVIFSAPLAAGTILQPAGKFYGDAVGELVGPAWTGPNGIANVNDIIAAVQYFNGVATRPHFTVVDIHDQEPNELLNVTDILLLVLGVNGNAYPYVVPSACP